MQKDLIKELCLTQDLIDISGIGTASQSSTSKWSKENDAQRALSNNNFANFAFHTEKEKNPWWQVEFEKPVNPEYVVINNRKQEPFDERASELSVIAYDDEDNEKLLHSGTVYFGSENQGCPLIIPMKGKVSITRLKITLLKEDYLHLSNISFLISDPLRSFGDKPVFIANRGDGLGERLRALLNSMVLAKEFDGHFIFSWPLSFSKSEFHAIDKPENVFSRDFIDSYLVTRNVLNRCEIKDLRNTMDFISCDNDGYKKIGINLDQTSLKNQIKDKNLQPKNLISEYKIAFEKISFNEGVTEAINLARSVQLKDKVLGIHLRTGDIVYSDYRYMDRYYNKVVPFYTVESLITRHLEMGYDIVLFSLDSSACRYFKDKYGVVISNDLIPEEYDDIQRAFFDIVLMSRCTEIVGGSSGFAILSSWIGGSKISTYKKILSEEEIKSSFIHSLSENGVLSSGFISPLLKSFSIAHYLQSFKDFSSTIERIELLKKCIEIDNGNNYYRLLLALDYYKEKNFSAADAILLEAVNSTDKSNIKWLAKTKFPKVTILSGYTLELEKYATQGSIVAAYVAFLSRYYYDEIDMNIAFYEDFIQKQHNNKNSIDTEFLKEIQEKVNLKAENL